MAGEGGAETPGAPVLCRTVVFRTDAGSGEHQAVAAVPLARGARRVLRENSLAGGDRCAAPKAGFFHSQKILLGFGENRAECVRPALMAASRTRGRRPAGCVRSAEVPFTKMHYRIDASGALH